MCPGERRRTTQRFGVDAAYGQSPGRLDEERPVRVSTRRASSRWRQPSRVLRQPCPAEGEVRGEQIDAPCGLWALQNPEEDGCSSSRRRRIERPDGRMTRRAFRRSMPDAAGEGRAGRARPRHALAGSICVESKAEPRRRCAPVRPRGLQHPVASHPCQPDRPPPRRPLRRVWPAHRAARTDLAISCRHYTRPNPEPRSDSSFIVSRTPGSTCRRTS
jgi:hypothetical protein